MRVRPADNPKLAPVIERKLTRNLTTWGRCYQDSGLILIDPRLKPLDYLDTLVHELLHREFCFLREESVNEVAAIIARELWEKGFRRIEQ